MGQLINSSTYSDVTFMVEGRNIFAHKVILVQRSGYFDSLFSNNSIQVNAFDKIVANNEYRHFLYFIGSNTGLRHKTQHFYDTSGVHLHRRD